MLDSNYSTDDKRVEALIKQMTLEEKATLVTGAHQMELAAIPRLGIPVMKMADGPLGCCQGKATAFPSGTALGSTWDKELIHRVGIAMGREFKRKGRHVMLGPCINIVRIPHGGRNFESFGEDPWLNSRMAVSIIQGAQSQHVIACAKHFACNNQEHERLTINIEVDERTMREIYLPAFEASVKEAGVWSVMSAYNRLNGPYCTDNKFLQHDILKEEWGFKGFVVSDWGATHSTVESANAGMDLEMAGEAWVGQYWGKGQLAEACRKGEVSEEAIDDKVRRILRALVWTGEFDEPWTATEDEVVEHRALAREVAASGIVMLKNEGDILPLKVAELKTIAVIGPNAGAARTGGGSSRVHPWYSVDPLEGLRAKLPTGTLIIHEPGAYCPSETPSGTEPFDPNAARARAVEAARRANVAIVFAGVSRMEESESFDRPSFQLPEGQDELIRAVAAANSKTIVVMVAGSQCDMDAWIDNVPAVLQAWYPGQEGGHAIADILFGEVNPSGKLPMTFVRKWDDHPCKDNYPGNQYSEGLFVGYRHFDKNELAPLFPFGHGLSYTSFEYADLSIESAELQESGTAHVSFTVCNTGTKAGTEVAQVYVRDLECTVSRPFKELKGFEKVFLEPGESRNVRVELNQRAFAFFDVKSKTWLAGAGEYEVHVGSSSGNIRLTGGLTLHKTIESAV